MALLLDVVVALLLMAGVGLNLTAAIGLHRFPDVFCRMHAATKPATFGLLCVLAGAALAIGEIPAATKLGLVAVLQLATNPVGGHMVGRAAWKVGVATHAGTRVDGTAGSGTVHPHGSGTVHPHGSATVRPAGPADRG